MNCNCPTCKGRNPDAVGIAIAESEIIPYFKTELLKVRYPDHPIPFRHHGLLASCLSFGQAVAMARHIKDRQHCYGTDNTIFHKYKSQIESKFGIRIMTSAEMLAQFPKPLEVCEFNAEETSEQRRLRLSLN
jgi:hypothetical protein